MSGANLRGDVVTSNNVCERHAGATRGEGLVSATLFQRAGRSLPKAPKASLTSVFRERLPKQMAVEGERFKNYTF